MAMTGVLRPGHAQIRVLDLEAAVKFYGDVLGLVETGRDPQGRVYFKAWDERDHHSVILNPSDRAGIDFFGFKVASRADLDDFETKLKAYGLSVTRVPAGDLLETGERVRFRLPSGHDIELYADKTEVGNGMPEINPFPWNDRAEHGIAPVRMDHVLLYGPNISENKKIFTEILGFYLVEHVLLPEGTPGDAAIWLSCSMKSHDIAFVEYAEPGKLHHVSYYLETWEKTLRAGDIMSMNNVPVDIGPTRHGITRGATIYAWDPSGNRFETFSGGYQPYPDWKPRTWTFENLGQGLDFPQRKLHETFLTVVT
jgi:catechol 2,3-dioxygenase